jgi:hypothetical protein
LGRALIVEGIAVQCDWRHRHEGQSPTREAIEDVLQNRFSSLATTSVDVSLSVGTDAYKSLISEEDYATLSSISYPVANLYQSNEVLGLKILEKISYITEVGTHPQIPKMFGGQYQKQYDGDDNLSLSSFPSTPPISRIDYYLFVEKDDQALPNYLDSASIDWSPLCTHYYLYKENTNVLKQIIVLNDPKGSQIIEVNTGDASNLTVASVDYNVDGDLVSVVVEGDTTLFNPVTSGSDKMSKKYSIA